MSSSDLIFTDESSTYGNLKAPTVSLSIKPATAKQLTISESYLQMALQHCKQDASRARKNTSIHKRESTSSDKLIPPKSLEAI